MTIRITLTTKNGEEEVKKKLFLDMDDLVPDHVIEDAIEDYLEDNDIEHDYFNFDEFNELLSNEVELRGETIRTLCKLLKDNNIDISCIDIPESLGIDKYTTDFRGCEVSFVSGDRKWTEIMDLNMDTSIDDQVWAHLEKIGEKEPVHYRWIEIK